MDFQPLAKLVTKTAPILGSLLGSPVAGAILSLIASHFNLADKHDIQAITDAINQDPVKLKELEYKHREALLEMILSFISKSETASYPWVAAVVTLIAVIGIILAGYFVIGVVNV